MGEYEKMTLDLEDIVRKYLQDTYPGQDWQLEEILKSETGGHIAACQRRLSRSVESTEQTGGPTKVPATNLLTRVPQEKQVADLLTAALASAGDHAVTLAAALEKVPEEQLDSMAFLVACMPPHDLAGISQELLLETVSCAFEAKAAMPWGSSIPESLFLEWVLPYVQANETREQWRSMMLSLFGPQVQVLESVEEAVKLLNKEVFAQLGVSYHASKRPKPDQSPNESIQAQYASCTGLSILLADACRSVCIPARLASVPLWSDREKSQGHDPRTWQGSGNHTWVEIWDPAVRKWRYIGASEQGDLDKTWFTGKTQKVDASHPLTCIYALSFKPTGTLFPCVWLPDNDYVWGEDITSHYTEGAESCETFPLWWQTFVRPEAIQQDRDKAEEPGSRLSATPSQKPDDPVLAAEIELKSWSELLAETGSFELNQVAALRAVLWEKFKNDVVTNSVRIGEMQNCVVSTDRGKLMRFSVEVVGARLEPEAGFPVYICLHGGGGCPPEINDEQWRQMQRYYKDSVRCGIYIAPRACEDTWNCHWVGDSYALYDRIIQNSIAFLHADPNRVYILGYSAGGDAVYQLAPRMADRWAAANMSAGHPNGASVHNLYHVPLLLQVGERDHAYKRNEVAVEYSKKLQNRRAKYPGGYISECWVHKGAGHSYCQDRDPGCKQHPVISCHGCGDGVELCNTNAVAWLQRYARNPVPRHLIWDVGTKGIRTRPAGSVAEELSPPHMRFYWLDISGLERYDAACVEVKCCREENTIEIISCGSWLRLLLDSRLVNLDERVVIKGGNFHAEVQLKPSLTTLSRTLLERGDPELMFEAEVTISWDGEGCHISVGNGEVLKAPTAGETLEPLQRALSQALA
eukprot:TRINITY_DN98099_c0_g1_i1.p1 TRINITY_DN98099_c0_g1~~TRINITY_DN98099_c0_g1_i1.p1  ORF type:complete len:863 (+),score=134.32 TRINITY_DN98099_c0_g1_i1:109-2697(+)